MRVCRKIMAMLILACLAINMIPAAAAVDLDVRLAVATNYSELEKKVAIGNGLNAYDYTKETWTILEKALKNGNSILKGSHGQKVVDDAVAAIENALDGLVKMDYSALDNVVAEVYTKLDENGELYDAWYQLYFAVEAARSQLVSGDQVAVNEAAERLRGLLEELERCTDPEREPEIVIQEVEVEVLPTDDFCNIPMHRTWPVLFVISAVLNVALIVVLTYVITKRRQTVDNTPLVSYDIDDDMDY